MHQETKNECVQVFYYVPTSTPHRQHTLPTCWITNHHTNTFVINPQKPNN